MATSGEQATSQLSEEQLKAFIEKDKGDTSLQEKLKGAAESDSALDIAKEAGFAITAEHIHWMDSATEWTDLEREGVAGDSPSKYILGWASICYISSPHSVI